MTCLSLSTLSVQQVVVNIVRLRPVLLVIVVVVVTTIIIVTNSTSENDSFNRLYKEQLQARYHPNLRRSVMLPTTNHTTTFHQSQRQHESPRALILAIRDEDSQSPIHCHYRHFIPSKIFMNDNDHDNQNEDEGKFNRQPTNAPIQLIQTQPTIEIPIMIQLSGEFGNHLSKIAAGIGVAAMIHRYNHHRPSNTPKYRFTTNLHIRHQDHTTKGETALQILQQCFPNLLHIQDEEDMRVVVNQTTLLNHPTQQQQQQTLLWTVPNSNTNPYQNVNSHHAAEVDTAIHRIMQDAISAFEAMNRNDLSSATTTTTTTTTTPFIVYSNHLVGFFDVYMDRFYDLYRQYFIINETNPTCGCIATTYKEDNDNSNDIVFYFRGYQIEMPKKAIKLGYEEVSPNTLVSYLQNISLHNTNMDIRRELQSVSIVSRFPNHTQPYTMALTDAGYSVRIIQHSSSDSSSSGFTSILHDFCFLRRTTTILIGPIRSTYFMWASLLAIHSKYNSNTHSTTTISPSLHITAYTTLSQMDWAQQQQQQKNEVSSNNDSIPTTTKNTVALDSITPINYYRDIDPTNIDSPSTGEYYTLLWKERNFHFEVL